MKTLFLILIISFTSFAQMNPDGYIGGVSLHFTPAISFGSADYSIGGSQQGDIEYPLGIGYDLRVALPVSQTTTVSVFFNNRPVDSEFEAGVFSDKISGSISTLGARLSFYFK